MPDMIKDGTGRGFLAEVDNENRLVTKSTQISHIAHHTLVHENSFNTYLRHIHVAGASDEIMAHMTYTGNHHIVVVRTVFTTNSIGETKFELFINPTALSGGATATPTNLHVASRNTLDITIVDTNNGASPINATGNGTEISDVRIGWQSQPTYSYEWDNALLLSKNDTLMVLVNAATNGDVIRCNILYFEEEIR